MSLEKKVISILKKSYLYSLMRTLASLHIPDCWIASGAIRDVVWSDITGRHVEPADIDIGFYEEGGDCQKNVEDKLKKVFTPEVFAKCEIVNNRFIHEYHSLMFGYPCAPFLSSKDAIRVFPESCNTIGARYRARSIKIYAPCGCEDLLNMVIRPNTGCIYLTAYRRRFFEKRWLQRWPEATVYLP